VVFDKRARGKFCTCSKSGQSEDILLGCDLEKRRERWDNIIRCAAIGSAPILA